MRLDDQRESSNIENRRNEGGIGFGGSGQQAGGLGGGQGSLLGIFLPLITTNCAVLGVPLLNVALHHDLLESLLFGFGSSVGFSLALVLFAGIRERLDGADVPTPFKGTAIAMVTAGLMSLAFMGFAGLDKFH